MITASSTAMINPDNIPWWFALPVFLILIVVLIVVEHRATKKAIREAEVNFEKFIKETQGGIPLGPSWVARAGFWHALDGSGRKIAITPRNDPPRLFDQNAQEEVK